MTGRFLKRGGKLNFNHKGAVIMREETVKFDLLGQRRLVFGEDTVTHITNELYLVPLHGWTIGARIVNNRPLHYQDIR
jgi:hypothetical protein